MLHTSVVYVCLSVETVDLIHICTLTTTLCFNRTHRSNARKSRVWRRLRCFQTRSPTEPPTLAVENIVRMETLVCVVLCEMWVCLYVWVCTFVYVLYVSMCTGVIVHVVMYDLSEV